MVCMPKPSTASSSGTTAVIGELSKMLIHMPMTSSDGADAPHGDADADADDQRQPHADAEGLERDPDRLEEAVGR